MARLGKRGRGLPAAVAGLAVALALAAACSSFDRSAFEPPRIEGAAFVGDQACQDCHPRITRAFPQSAHARLHPPGAGGRDHACESCHGPAEAHVASGGAGPDRHIVNPGRDPQACYQCHLEVSAEFHLPRHHPVTEEKMTCAACHDPHGLDIAKPAGGAMMARRNETCAGCHREQTRPFVFEHAAMREGCVSCHSPHGSINAKLLTVRDSNLCLRCHAQVPGPGAAGGFYIGRVDHSGLLRYGTCWTAGCHAAIHGSNTQPYYFY